MQKVEQMRDIGTNTISFERDGEFTSFHCCEDDDEGNSVSVNLNLMECNELNKGDLEVLIPKLISFYQILGGDKSRLEINR